MMTRITPLGLALCAACSGPSETAMTPAPGAAGTAPLMPEFPIATGGTQAIDEVANMAPDPVSTAGSGGMANDVEPVEPEPVAETPPAEWVNVTANLANMASECGNLGRVSSNPNVDMLIVGVAQRGLWASTDGAESFVEIGSGGSPITNRISWLSYDPSSANVFWESGIYNDGGVYRTDDNGATFTQLGSVTHCDSVSVDFSDPERKTLLAGGHEQSQTVHLSTDGGQSWTNIGDRLPGSSGFCTTSTILDSQTFLIGCGGWYGGDPGIYRSEDGGGLFSKVSDVGVAGQPLRASDGTIYWAGHQAGGLYRSTDQGASFSQIADSSTAVSAEPIELPDGRIVTVGSQTLMVSEDSGESFEPFGDPLPFTANGVTYSPFRNAFYVWHWDCENTVPTDAIARFGYDYRSP